jgi:lipoate-protein ligase B
MRLNNLLYELEHPHPDAIVLYEFAQERTEDSDRHRLAPGAVVAWKLRPALEVRRGLITVRQLTKGIEQAIGTAPEDEVNHESVPVEDRSPVWVAAPDGRDLAVVAVRSVAAQSPNGVVLLVVADVADYVGAR